MLLSAEEILPKLKSFLFCCLIFDMTYSKSKNSDCQCVFATSIHHFPYCLQYRANYMRLIIDQFGKSKSSKLALESFIPDNGDIFLLRLKKNLTKRY